MADRRYALIFAAAILTACLATFGVWRVLGRADADAAGRPVVVVVRDVHEGETLDRAAVRVASWPAAAVPAGAHATPDSLVGRVLRMPLLRGAAVRESELAPRGTAAGLEGDIAPGRRAMAIRVSDAAGQSALVRPNSHVDVLVATRDAGPGLPAVARLAMSDVRVLGVGDARAERVGAATDGPPQPPSSIVTLEVTPEQAELLAMAETQGTIQLVLRGYRSTDTSRTRGATARDVLGAAAPAGGAGAASGPEAAGAAPRVSIAGGVALDLVRRGSAAPARPRPVAETTPAATAARALRDSTLLVRVYRGAQETVQRVDPAAPVPRAATVDPLPAARTALLRGSP